MRRYEKEVEKKLSSPFNHLKSRATSKKSGIVIPAVISKGDHALKVVLVQVFRTDARVLLDTGDVTNLISM